MNNWKFLLVDDSKMSNKILSDILISAGYFNMSIFSSALDVVEYLKTDTNVCNNILLTDLIMPVMDGLQLSKFIKSDKQFSDIPIIMITSSNDIENLQEAFNVGILEYIIKPFNSIEVITRIKSVLRLKDEMIIRQQHERNLEQLNKILVEDLNIARHLQFQMLPTPVNTKHIGIKGYYLPVMSLGGDLYYWQKINEDKYGVILLDIMGHGTATSMITMYIRSILPRVFKKYENPSELIKYLNEFIIDFNTNLGDQEYHCSAFYIVFDTKNKTAEYVNAGHPPLAFIQNDNQVIWMDKGCPPIGIFKNIPIMQETISYQNESHALTYSDGMFELLKEKNIDILTIHQKYKFNYNAFLKGESSQLDSLFKEIENMDRTDDVSLVLIKLFN